MKNTGFTLIELLVVVAILSIMGVLILIIFTNTLRGSNKSQIIGVIKQNGQSILEIMDKTARNADSIVCPIIPYSGTTAVGPVLITKNSSGAYTRFKFVGPIPLLSNGLIYQDNPIKQIVGGSQETDEVFASRVCNPGDVVLPTALVLTDTKPQTGISVENGSFTREKTPGFKDKITIKFGLRSGVQAPAAVAQQIDLVNFQTTIQLR